MPLNPYQKRIIELYDSTNYYAQNKARGAGTSELLTVRYQAWKYMTVKNAGRKCLIIGGINGDTSRIFLHRIKMLCDKHPEVYLYPPKSDYPSEISFKQGGIIKALPARADVVRSLENVGDVIYEEAGFWNMVDDKPVLKAGEPHVVKSRAHISHISTPNGRRGYLWEKIFDPACDPPTKYFKHVLNWREVVGIPEPDPDVLKDFDVEERESINRFYLNRYQKDLEYRKWFDNLFPGRTVNEILNVISPILDIKEIVKLYSTDRASYDQELDNQFTLSTNRAFPGEWPEADFLPIEFNLEDFEE